MCVFATTNGETGTEILTGMGIGETKNKKIPLLFLTRRGDSAKFAVALEPREDTTSKIKNVNIVNSEPGVTFLQVHFSNGILETFAYNPKKQKCQIEDIRLATKEFLFSQRHKDRPGQDLRRIEF